MKIILTHIQGSRAGTKEEYEGPIVRIGRDPRDCELIFSSLDEPGVSRLHAEITFLEGVFYLEDLNSRNGTYLDAAPVKGKVKLLQGNLIQFGVEGPTVRFEFEFDKDYKSLLQTQPVLTVGPQAKALASASERPILVCEGCGASFNVTVKFCRHCGKSFPVDVVTKEPDTKINPSRAGLELETTPNDKPAEEGRKCYSCNEWIVGDPRYCPGCGAVLKPGSARLHSDDLSD
ncbi:MAG: FHA domain-containing protein, partial [Acidobacteriota bacterium]